MSTKISKEEVLENILKSPSYKNIRIVFNKEQFKKITEILKKVSLDDLMEYFSKNSFPSLMFQNLTKNK